MSERGYMKMNLPSGGIIEFAFPNVATRDDIWFAREVVKLQIDTWERRNIEREQRIVDEWCSAITRLHYGGGYP